MDLKLKLARTEDAEQIWKMQIEAFSELYARYQDTDTSPAAEPLEKTVWRLQFPSTFYYLILADGETAGAIRVIDHKDGVTPKRISPLFVLPAFRNKGIAQKAILAAEEIHGSNNWCLDTILQEKGNCHLYEKMGYRSTGETKAVNDKLTLIWYKK